MSHRRRRGRSVPQRSSSSTQPVEEWRGRITLHRLTRAGFYVSDDGRVNPVDAAMALAKGARMHGTPALRGGMSCLFGQIRVARCIARADALRDRASTVHDLSLHSVHIHASSSIQRSVSDSGARASALHAVPVPLRCTPSPCRAPTDSSAAQALRSSRARQSPLCSRPGRARTAGAPHSAWRCVHAAAGTRSWLQRAQCSH